MQDRVVHDERPNPQVSAFHGIRLTRAESRASAAGIPGRSWCCSGSSNPKRRDRCCRSCQSRSSNSGYMCQRTWSSGVMQGTSTPPIVPDSDEAVAWPAVGRPAGLLRLPAVAVFVELEWMRVDPAPGRIGEDEARRPFEVRAREFVEHVADCLDVFRAHAEVEVVVRARLLSEQRVDAPAALEPEVDARRAQAFDDVDDALRGPVVLRLRSLEPLGVERLDRVGGAADERLDVVGRSEVRKHVVRELARGLRVPAGRRRRVGAESPASSGAPPPNEVRCAQPARRRVVPGAGPRSRSISSCTTRIASGSTLKNRAAASTDWPDSFMNVSGFSRPTRWSSTRTSASRPLNFPFHDAP